MRGPHCAVLPCELHGVAISASMGIASPDISIATSAGAGADDWKCKAAGIGRRSFRRWPTRDWAAVQRRHG